LYERLFSSYVQKTRAKNARENVGEIDPWSKMSQEPAYNNQFSPL
jgi:hypothetical protein